MQETKIGMKVEEETKSIKKMCEQLGKSIEYQFDKGIEQIDTEEMKEAIDMLKDLYAMKKDIVEACYYKQIMEAMEESEYGEDYNEDGPMENERRGYRGQPRSESGRFMRRGDGRRNNRGRGGRRGYEEMDYMMPMEWDDMEQMRDMDRGYGRMYYSGGGSGSSGGGQSSGGSSSGMSGGQSSGGSSGGSGGGGSRGYSEGGQGGRGNEGGQSRDGREGRSGQSRRGYMEAKEQGKDKQEKMKELENYMKELSSDVTEMIGDASPEEKTMLKNKMQMLMQKIQ